MIIHRYIYFVLLFSRETNYNHSIVVRVILWTSTGKIIDRSPHLYVFQDCGFIFTIFFCPPLYSLLSIFREKKLFFFPFHRKVIKSNKKNLLNKDNIVFCIYSLCFIFTLSQILKYLHKYLNNSTIYLIYFWVFNWLKTFIKYTQFSKYKWFMIR